MIQITNFFFLICSDGNSNCRTEQFELLTKFYKNCFLSKNFFPICFITNNRLFLPFSHNGLTKWWKFSLQIMKFTYSSINQVLFPLNLKVFFLFKFFFFFFSLSISLALSLSLSPPYICHSISMFVYLYLCLSFLFFLFLSYILNNKRAISLPKLDFLHPIIIVTRMNRICHSHLYFANMKWGGYIANWIQF